MPLFDHLGELRMRLVRIVACLAIAVVVFYMATPTMGQFLLQPIFDFLPKNADGSLALIAVLAIPAALLVGLIYLVWTVSDAVTGRLEHRTDYL